jgi:hypothetical protein
MGASPDWKVYSEGGEYVAACKYPEDAAMIITGRMGGTIRWGHSNRRTVWREGHEAQPAGESFDLVAETCLRRRHEFLERQRATDTQKLQIDEEAQG